MDFERKEASEAEPWTEENVNGSTTARGGSQTLKREESPTGSLREPSQRGGSWPHTPEVSVGRTEIKTAASQTLKTCPFSWADSVLLMTPRYPPWGRVSLCKKKFGSLSQVNKKLGGRGLLIRGQRTPCSQLLQAKRKEGSPLQPAGSLTVLRAAILLSWGRQTFLDEQGTSEVPPKSKISLRTQERRCLRQASRSEVTDSEEQVGGALAGDSVIFFSPVQDHFTWALGQLLQPGSL